MKRAEMQVTEQERKQAKLRGGNPNWVPGRSQNPKGRESKAQRHARRERIIKEWCKPHAGLAALRPAELMLLHEAAELMLVRVRNSVEQVRRANTISKILRQVGFLDKRGRPREPSQFEGRRSLGRAPRQARAQRVFQGLGWNHMKRDEKGGRYLTEQGVTKGEFRVGRVIGPIEIRPGETA